MTSQTWMKLIPAALLLASLMMAQDSSPSKLRSKIAAGGILIVKHELNYTMNVKVRPFLFWMEWDSVGEGRIVLIDRPGGEAELELLIGSDPARAPRHINRWGFIAEHVSGSSARHIGIMTQSDEREIEEAKATISLPGKMHTFKAIRSRLSGSEASSFTFPLRSNQNFTYRDASLLLGQIPETASFTRKLQIPPNTDLGFLSSVRALVCESVDQYRTSGKLVGVKPRNYVYNASLFKLSLRSSSLLRKMVMRNQEYHELIESRFEALNTASGKPSCFTITYGTNEGLSKIPIRITYQPRWWFQAELLLDDGTVLEHPTRKEGDK